MRSKDGSVLSKNVSIATGIAVFALLATSAHAQHMNAPDAPCVGVEITSDRVACLGRAREAADRELNRTYQAVLATLAPPDRARLVQAQRSWLAYRDQACAAEHALYGGGTGGPPAELACLEALTRHRTAELQAGYGWKLRQGRPGS